jgi:hypothetical protein
MLMLLLLRLLRWRRGREFFTITRGTESPDMLWNMGTNYTVEVKIRPENVRAA